MIDPRSVTRRRAVLHSRVVLTAASIALIANLLGVAFGWWSALEGVETLVIIFASVTFIAVGSLIIRKADSNRVGWVFALVGISILLSGVTAGLADRGLLVFDAIGGAFWLSWLAAVGLVVLWYPNGRPPGLRWMWVQWLGLALIGLVMALYVFTEELCSAYAEVQGCIGYVANPIGIPGVPNPEFGWIAGPLFTGVAVFLLASLASLMMRFRRARGVERLQLKWFLLSCAIFAVAFTGSISFEAWSGRSPPFWLDTLFQVAILAMPVAATVAILRYRLYEIDRIISRTVTYALVVGFLGLLVASVAAVAGSQFETPWVVAATTLGVAALFNPVRRRVQVWVDRRFNRSKYDAERVVAEFARSLRDRVDAGGVLDGWLAVVDSTMQPVAVGVWVRE